ncbi:hypothetical protein [Streptomyces sp. TP-A0356]|uniref:hypothetical protein n=1 Tax=Streptomyces sp. TP-A0356 TaxID=1359208 RepID=UPI00131D49F2|nr:hypothetical protein [Streptomyces sp. TP-A0356]
MESRTQWSTGTAASRSGAAPDKEGTLHALQTGAIGAASVAAVGGLAYGILTRKRRELMREWVMPLHRALAVPLGIAELRCLGFVSVVVRVGGGVLGWGVPGLVSGCLWVGGSLS